MDKTTRNVRHALTHTLREGADDVTKGKIVKKEPHGDDAAGRYQVQVHFGGATKSGFSEDSETVHKYGLGDSIIIAGLLQYKIGFFDYIRAQVKPHYFKIFEGFENIAWREIGKNVSQDLMIDYTFANEKEEGVLKILSPTLALNPAYRLPVLKEKIRDDDYRNKIAYSFDNEEKLQVPEGWLDNWRRINRNVIHVGKMRYNIERTCHIIQNCERYEGSLNGMAFLAIAAGKPTTVWLPADQSIIKKDPLYKTRMYILKKYGVTFKYIGDPVERTGTINTDIDTASL